MFFHPPDMRIPGYWRLSAGGIPIPPEPHGNARGLGDDDCALLQRPHARAASGATVEP